MSLFRTPKMLYVCFPTFLLSAFSVKKITQKNLRMSEKCCIFVVRKERERPHPLCPFRGRGVECKGKRQRMLAQAGRETTASGERGYSKRKKEENVVLTGVSRPRESTRKGASAMKTLFRQGGRRE